MNAARAWLAEGLERADAERPSDIIVYRGMRAAINAKCRDCIFDPKCGGGTWRAQAAKCPSIACSLWPVRPAPTDGALADPPRDPNNVPAGWGGLPVDDARWGAKWWETATPCSANAAVPANLRQDGAATSHGATTATDVAGQAGQREAA